MVTRFLQTTVCGGGGFGSRVVGWHMLHGWKNDQSGLLFCVCFASFFSEFYLYLTSMIDCRRQNTDQYGGVKGRRIGVGMRRVELPWPRCLRLVGEVSGGGR